MVNSHSGAKKAIETQKAKYADKGGLSAEMARRARLRKTIGKGGFYDPEVSKRAAAKSAEVRSANAEKRKAEQERQNEHKPAKERR